MKAFKPLVLVILCTALVYGCFVLISDKILESVDRRNYQMYVKGDGYYLPLREGLPWELFALYRDALRLSPEKNVIFFGASTTALGVIPEMLDVPDSFRFSNLSIAADNADGFSILLRYLDGHAPHSPGKKDIVFVNIEQASFVERKAEESPMRRYLEIFGFYSVSDDFQISGEASSLKVKWALMNFKIRLAASALVMNINTGFGPNLDTLQAMKRAISARFRQDAGKRRAVLNAPDRAERFSEFWVGYMGTTTIPNSVTKRFQQFLLDLQSRTNVVVVNLFGGPWTRNYRVGNEYDAWVRGELKGFLDEHAIPFLDYSRSLPASDFLDASHLSRQGREHFTHLFNSDMRALVGRSGSIRGFSAATVHGRSRTEGTE